MRLKILWRIMVIYIAITLFFPTALVAKENISIRILFTHNSNGKLVNCHCRNDHYGGLAERIDFIRSYRKKQPEFLLVDSGGYFGLSDTDRKMRLILILMDKMGYDALGVGDQELYQGLRFFRDVSGNNSKKIINASIRTNEGKEVFSPYKIISVKDVKLGIIGLVSPETFRFLPEDNQDFIVEQPDSVLKRVMPSLEKSCDYILVLSQMGIDKDKEIAKKWSDIDLIIGGHSQTLLSKPVVIGKCRIVQAGSYARRVGEISLSFNSSKNINRFAYELHEITDTYTIPSDIQGIMNNYLKEK